MHVLTTAPAWLPPMLVSPFIGSFMGVLIARLPRGLPIVAARSMCDRCGHPLAPRDLIPIASYALSGGRCRYCEAAIGEFPLAVELAAFAVAIWAATRVTTNDIWMTCLLGWVLLTAAWIDARTLLLPDVLTLPLLLAGLAMTWLTDPDQLGDHALGALLGCLSLAGFAWTYRRIRGRDGLGFGDAKLLGAAGAWLGVGLLPMTLFVAAGVGLMTAGAAWLAGKRLTAATAIPFGPCLAVAIWLMWLYAGGIEDWWLN